MILANISLGKSRPTSSSHGASLADSFAELETHLGDTYHPYLTVRLSYKHSGFQNSEGSGSLYDRGSCVTHIQTDVVSMIKRHDKQAAWSPRASRVASSCFDDSLVKLARKHLPRDEAADAIAKMTCKSHPYTSARAPSKIENYSDDTVTSPDDTTSPIPKSFQSQVPNHQQYQALIE